MITLSTWYTGTVWRNHAWNHRRDTFASIRAGHTRAVAGRGAGALTDDSSTPRVLKQINKQGLGGTKVYRGRRRRCIVTCDRVVAVRLLYFKLRFSAVQGAPLIFQLNNNQIARLHWFMLLLTRSGTKHRNINTCMRAPIAAGLAVPAWTFRDNQTLRYSQVSLASTQVTAYYFTRFKSKTFLYFLVVLVL
jgi:hypothetical protein